MQRLQRARPASRGGGRNAVACIESQNPGLDGCNALGGPAAAPPSTPVHARCSTSTGQCMPLVCPLCATTCVLPPHFVVALTTRRLCIGCGRAGPPRHHYGSQSWHCALAFALWMVAASGCALVCTIRSIRCFSASVCLVRIPPWGPQPACGMHHQGRAPCLINGVCQAAST